MSKPEYIIMNDGSGFALYRKLFPGEYFWYRKELYRLRLHENDFWLRLECDNNRDALEIRLEKLRKKSLAF